MDNKTSSEAMCQSENEGMFPFCVEAKRCHHTVSTSAFLTNWLWGFLRLMHRSQKSFLPRFLHDLPVGHDTLLNAPLYQTWSFQDNANDDKFHPPALCALPLISLIQECAEGSALSAEGHVVWLHDAEAAAFIPTVQKQARRLISTSIIKRNKWSV